MPNTAIFYYLFNLSAHKFREFAYGWSIEIPFVKKLYSNMSINHSKHSNLNNKL